MIAGRGVQTRGSSHAGFTRGETHASNGHTGMYAQGLREAWTAQRNGKSPAFCAMQGEPHGGERPDMGEQQCGERRHREVAAGP
jgi:hypothetical protein